MEFLVDEERHHLEFDLMQGNDQWKSECYPTDAQRMTNGDEEKSMASMLPQETEIGRVRH